MEYFKNVVINSSFVTSFFLSCKKESENCFCNVDSLKKINKLLSKGHKIVKISIENSQVDAGNKEYVLMISFSKSTEA